MRHHFSQYSGHCSPAIVKAHNYSDSSGALRTSLITQGRFRRTRREIVDTDSQLSPATRHPTKSLSPVRRTEGCGSPATTR